MAVEAENSAFTRNFEVYQCEKPLVLYQHGVGEVGCVVWDAALVLASYLQKLAIENENYFKGKKVVELGSGVGCVGLTAACLGADAVLTDLPEVLPLLEHNILANSEIWKPRGRALATALKWESVGNSVHGNGNVQGNVQSVDILLLADCVYYTESVAPLVMTMRKLSNKDTVLLICQEQRSSEKQVATWAQFFELVSQYFMLTRIPLSEQHPHFSSPDILLFKAKLKGS